MKRIKIAIFSILAIGCFVPTAVRAEAPMPKGGCWTRDISMRPTNDPQVLTTIKGRIIAIEHGKSQQIAAKEMVTWLRVRTIDGKEQSIYLGSNQSLKQQRLQVKVSDAIEVQGIQMPKVRQLPMTIASTIKKGDRVWKINNIADKPTGAKWCKYSG
jgi:hypothetical protein